MVVCALTNDALVIDGIVQDLLLPGPALMLGWRVHKVGEPTTIHRTAGRSGSPADATPRRVDRTWRECFGPCGVGSCRGHRSHRRPADHSLSYFPGQGRRRQSSLCDQHWTGKSQSLGSQDVRPRHPPESLGRAVQISRPLLAKLHRHFYRYMYGSRGNSDLMSETKFCSAEGQLRRTCTPTRRLELTPRPHRWPPR
jgi:hypothetical protein